MGQTRKQTLTQQNDQTTRKTSPNVIENVYDEWMRERNEKASAALCDVVISKFALLLGGVDAIEDPKTLEEELKSDELLRADIERITMTIAPYLLLFNFFKKTTVALQHK